MENKCRRRVQSTPLHLPLLATLLVACINIKGSCSTPTIYTSLGVNYGKTQFSRRLTDLDLSTSSNPMMVPRGGADLALTTSSNPVMVPRGGASTGSSTSISRIKTPSSSDRSDAIKSAGEKKFIMHLIRVLFLTFYGSLGALMPYLPVYYHSLGHDGLYIGLLGAVKPFTTFLVAPLWGIFSDKTGKHHAILQYTFISSLILQLGVFLRGEVWFMVTFTCLAALLNTPVKSLLDSMVLDVLPANEKSNYGKLRLWGQLGFGLGSSGIGVLLSHTCAANNAGIPRFLRGYGVAFLVHALLSIPVLLCMKIFERYSNPVRSPSTTSVDKKSRGPQIMDGLNLLVHNADAMLFFFLVLVVGMSSGIIENFAYVRMREVGGTGKEMGLSRLVSSAAGAPMFWFSGPLASKLGVDKVLVLSILSYVVRFCIYAFMSNAYQMLPAEALRGVTFAAFWSTGTIYAHKISPPGLSATMLMFLNAMYGGLGQSLGSIIGGKMQSKMGTVKTFLYTGAFDLVFAGMVIIYLTMKTGESSFRNPKPISKPLIDKTL